MAAAWDGVGTASNLLQLLGVDALGLASMITQAALTARRNRDACLQLAEHVRVVEGLLRRLHLVLPQLRRHPETRRPLEQLDDALRRAYLLVRSCGQELEFRSYFYQLLTGGHTTAKLRAAEEEIDRYIRLIPMIGLVATARAEWARYLDDGTRQSIEGATIYDYVVTANDVDTILAVECIPMDDNGLQGELVKKFSNGKCKIACDSDMQNEIGACIANGEALFNVFSMTDSSGDWDPSTLMLKRTSYQIKIGHTDEITIEGIYSQILEIKIPHGRTTQFSLVKSGGLCVPFNTSGIAELNNEYNDIRLRDLMVLVMRAFQKEVLTLEAEEGD